MIPFFQGEQNKNKQKFSKTPSCSLRFLGLGFLCRLSIALIFQPGHVDVCEKNYICSHSGRNSGKCRVA
jgi:hypothetical protein